MSYLLLNSSHILSCCQCCLLTCAEQIQCPPATDEFGSAIKPNDRAHDMVKADYRGLSMMLRSSSGRAWAPSTTSINSEKSDRFSTSNFVELTEILEMPPEVTAILNWQLVPQSTMLWHDNISKLAVDVFAVKSTRGVLANFCLR